MSEESGGGRLATATPMKVRSRACPAKKEHAPHRLPRRTVTTPIPLSAASETALRMAADPTSVPCPLSPSMMAAEGETVRTVSFGCASKAPDRICRTRSGIRATPSIVMPRMSANSRCSAIWRALSESIATATKIRSTKAWRSSMAAYSISEAHRVMHSVEIQGRRRYTMRPTQ